MGKIAFVFAGQGAQYKGMGKSLADYSENASEIFRRIDKVRPKTSKQCFTAETEELMKTDVTQPCVYAVDLAVAYALKGENIFPSAVAGYSLGELAALTFAESISIEDGVELVSARGKAMQKASGLYDSGMMAVLKLDDETVREIAGKYDEVYPVNFNCRGQVTVAGINDELMEFKDDIKAKGGLVRILEVAGGFHSPFMEKAAEELEPIVRNFKIKENVIPVYSNYTGEKYAGDYAETMLKQITNPILWSKTIENMIEDGIDTFIEVGPGSALSKMITRISKDVTMINVENKETLEIAIEIAGGKK